HMGCGALSFERKTNTGPGDRGGVASRAGFNALKTSQSMRRLPAQVYFSAQSNKLDVLHELGRDRGEVRRMRGTVCSSCPPRRAFTLHCTCCRNSPPRTLRSLWGSVPTPGGPSSGGLDLPSIIHTKRGRIVLVATALAVIGAIALLTSALSAPAPAPASADAITIYQVTVDG